MNKAMAFLSEGKMESVKRVTVGMRVKGDSSGTGDWFAGTVQSWDPKTGRATVKPVDGTEVVNISKDNLYKCTITELKEAESLHKDIRKQKEITGVSKGREELIKKGMMPLTKALIECDRCGHKNIEVWSNEPKTSCPGCCKVLYAADRFDDANIKHAAKRPSKPQTSTEWLVKISAEAGRIHEDAGVDLFDYDGTGARQFCIDLSDVPKSEHAMGGQKYFFGEHEPEEAWKMVQQLAPERLVKPDLSRYTVVKQVKTHSGRASVDVNDMVAAYFRGMEIDEVYAHTVLFLHNLGVTEVGSKRNKTMATNEALREKYKKLNVGMQRMNLGNLVRNAMKRLNIEELPHTPITPTMEL